MADEKKTDKRKITSVVFTPTGEWGSPGNDQWVDDQFWNMSKGPRATVGNIYTREVFHAPQAPLNEAGQAEPDLRERMLSSISDPSTRFIFEAVIDRLEAQEKRMRDACYLAGENNIRCWDGFRSIDRRLDKLQAGFTDIKTWVDRVKQVIP